MADKAEAGARNSLYDVDFHEWAVQQAQVLRERRWHDLDLENLVEEVEGVARSDKREIRSRLAVLVAHLLTWRYQPDRRSPSWTGTIFEQRHAISLVQQDSPSLRTYPAEILADQYRAARLLAVKETGIAYALFPDTCPFTIEEVLDDDFLPREPGQAHPEARHG